MKVVRLISALDRSSRAGFAVVAIVLAFSVMNCTAQQPPDNWWQKYSGYVRLTPLESGESFAQMQAQLPTLYSEGIRVIEVFGPYNAGPDYGGLSAIDFLAPSTGGGSMTDFQNLVNAAHAQGMAIIIFLANDYVHHTNAWWTTALNNPASTEHGYFLWSSGPAPTAQYPFLIMGGYWYNNAWVTWADNNGTYDLPSTNFGSVAWQTECPVITSFWMNTGIDGIIFDALPFDINMTWPVNNACMSDLVKSFGNGSNKWVIPEGGGSNSEITNPTVWITSGHYNGLEDYSLDLYWNTGNDPFPQAIRSGNPTIIETRLQQYRDQVVARGAVTLSGIPWNDPLANEQQRLLQIALTTSAGGVVAVNLADGNSYGWRTYISPAGLQLLYRMLNVQNAHPALLAAGGRKRIPTNADTKYYAYLRTSTDATENVLVVLNFQKATQSITVNLDGLGIPTQTPLELISNTNGPALSGTSYTVNLPAYGYGFYLVSTTNPPPPDFNVALSLASLTIASGQPGTAQVTIAPENGFAADVALSCSGLPSGATCSFAPNPAPSGTTTASLTVATGSASARVIRQNSRPLFPGGAILAVALCCLASRKRGRGLLLPPLAVGLIGVSLLIGCGGASSHHPTTSTVTVTATAGSLHHTATFSLTVQ